MKALNLFISVSAILILALANGCKTTPRDTMYVPEDDLVIVPDEVIPDIPAGVPLYKTVWKLDIDSLRGASKRWKKPLRDIDIIITSDFKVSGSGGVNRYFTTAKVNEDNKISFIHVGTTMMMGQGIEFETLYLRQLQSVDSYEIKGNTLYLKSLGKIMGKFTAVPETK